MTTQHENDLVLTRVIDAPAEKLYRCWTEPALMTQWFAPKPWSTPKAETDLRVGGASKIVMANPDGQQFPSEGVYLEIVPGKKIVFTDAYRAGWAPAANPFFTAILTFEDLGNGKTRYTAIARHWTAENKVAHEKMGFHEGWGQCADQLEALAKTI